MSLLGGGTVQPRVFVYILLSFVVSITIHEFAHAYTATLLGDGTARAQGRVTLNPIAHFDPIGFLFLIFLALSGTGLGWGKPVPFNPYHLRYGSKRGGAIVAAAGPLSNLILALVLALPRRFLPGTYATLPINVREFIGVLIALNLGLVAFNLIPLPPLDGLKILLGILPDFWYPVLAPLDRYGFVILFALIFFLPNLIFGISSPVSHALSHLILGTAHIIGPLLR